MSSTMSLSMSLLLSLSVLGLVHGDPLGLLIAVENRVEVISQDLNTTLRLPCQGTTLALASHPSTTEIFATELGCVP